MNLPNFGEYLSSIVSAPINLVADLLILALALFFIIRGAKRGFVGTTLNFIRPILVIVIAFSCASMLGEFLNETLGLFDGLKDSIFNTLKDIVLDEEFQTEHAGETVTGFTGIIGALLALAGDDFAVDLAGFVTGDTEVLMALSESIVSVVAVVVAFIALLLLGSIVIRLVIACINAIFKAPGLNLLNTLLGLVLGILIAAAGSWLISYLLYFVFSALASAGVPFFAGFSADMTYLVQMLVGFNPVQWALETLTDAMVFA